LIENSELKEHISLKRAESIWTTTVGPTKEFERYGVKKSGTLKSKEPEIPFTSWNSFIIEKKRTT